MTRALQQKSRFVDTYRVDSRTCAEPSGRCFDPGCPAKDDWPKSPSELAKSQRIGRGKILEWINTGRLEADNVASITSSLPRYLIQKSQWDHCRASLLSAPAVARRLLEHRRNRRTAARP